MRKIILTVFLFSLSYSIGYAQGSSSYTDKYKVKQTVIRFLSWYKDNGEKLETQPIVQGFNDTEVKKGDSVVRIDLTAVENYLSNFKKSGYVSDVFLNDLRQTYKKIADHLIASPIVDYVGPVPGLECDLLFGFEPEQITDHIHEGKFTKVYLIQHKALLQFKVSRINQLIFTLSKIDNNWLIDSIGYIYLNFGNKKKP